MARWMEAQMGNEPEVLTPAVLKELHVGRVNTRAPYGTTALGRALHDATYGLGWRSFTYAGHRLVGHSGAVAGYRSTMMFDPATRTGIAMLRSEAHTSELPSLMRISYAVFCFNTKQEQN